MRLGISSLDASLPACHAAQLVGHIPNSFFRADPTHRSRYTIDKQLASVLGATIDVDVCTCLGEGGNRDLECTERVNVPSCN